MQESVGLLGIGLGLADVGCDDGRDGDEVGKVTRDEQKTTGGSVGRGRAENVVGIRFELASLGDGVMVLVSRETTGRWPLCSLDLGKALCPWRCHLARTSCK